MLTSKSVQNCRLKASDPHVIRGINVTGLTTGRIDLSQATVKASGRSTIHQPKLSRRERAILKRKAS